MAQRTQLWLRRVHDVRVAVGTIQRMFRDIGLPRLRRTRKRVSRQMKLFDKAEPGDTVQVHVKFVKIAGRWAFQYTAVDDCTRFRVLRLSTGRAMEEEQQRIRAEGFDACIINPVLPESSSRLSNGWRDELAVSGLL